MAGRGPITAARSSIRWTCKNRNVIERYRDATAGPIAAGASGLLRDLVYEPA
ncbi:hypothetical protein ACIQU1_21760 [Streptomyces angustmyceticus]|uniref:hypothetical protein n=1 Tax=Streptomyces angustmyceticus TaxID=285578 RepID=UPI00344E145A